MLPILPVSAQGQKRLVICIYDYTTAQRIEDNTFLEGKKYDVSVGIEGQTGFAYGATVTVPWASYVLGQGMPWFTLETPPYEEYEGFVIVASKEGFTPDELVITVIKGNLVLTTDRGVVEEKESFQVTVHDQNGRGVEGTLVFLDIGSPESGSATTNADGKAYLNAPAVKEDTEIPVKAWKEGYDVVSTTLRVENVPTMILFDDIGSLVPVFLALITVVVAIMFVNFRKKSASSRLESGVDRSPMPKQRETFETKEPDPLIYTTTLQTKSVSRNGAREEETSKAKTGQKIEEIRLYKTGKKKETTCLTDEKPQKALPLTSSRKQDYTWFEGTDDIRYKIDKLTGDIDEERIDKWFEGIDDIRAKIDEKLNKKHKKQIK
jgi:hypothetical protein